MILVLAAAVALAQEKSRTPPPAQQPQAQQKEAEPPEEDEDLKPRETYTLNPIEAEHDVRIGDFYYKKGSYKAAAGRYREATRWNPQFAEAYRKLGEAEEKLLDTDAARDAYRKYLELDPKGKGANSIRKKVMAKK